MPRVGRSADEVRDQGASAPCGAFDPDRLHRGVAAIERAGGQAFAVRAELGLAGDVDTLFSGLERGLGGRPLDIVVNNAAIMSTRRRRPASGQGSP